MTSTTIKVPVALRDRLARRAAAEHLTLAGAIARALDESDQQRFWDAVASEHARLTPLERDSYLSTTPDGLADAEDEEISRRGEW